MRCPAALGFRVLAIAILIGWQAGAARDAHAQASTEDYAPPRHAGPLRLALSAMPVGSPPTDPLCSPSVSGVVVLDRDVFCGSDYELALESGATLDLGGFTFEGMISAAGQGSTLRNGTVVGGPVEFSSCEDCLIEGVHVRDGAEEFVVRPGPRNVVRASRFSDNDVAVDVYDVDDVTVVDCEFEHNGTGANLARGSRNRVSSSTFRGNHVGLNLWNEDGPFDDDSDVNDNTISEDDFLANDLGAVILVQHCEDPGCLEGNRFTDNVFSGNLGAGLFLPHPDPSGTVCSAPYDCGLADLRIEDNHFEANGFGPGVVGGDGLDVSGPPETTDGIVVARNAALANADLGIESPGVVDGGGNRARDNGNALQCVGVLCSLLVDIDVQERDAKLAFDARSHRSIAVAILGSRSFDVADVDVRSLAFGPAGASAERVRQRIARDENGDGFSDLVVRFRNHETGVALGDRKVCLVGETLAGVPFAGCVAIPRLRDCGRGFELALLLAPLLWLRRGWTPRAGAPRSV